MKNQEKKLNLKSKDIISHNVELINQLFPHCITEQGGKKVVDFEKLKQEFSDDIVDEIKEKYELTWPGKREAIREARISTTKTLLPDMNKSVDFENTNNVYIEGDNLEVLKVLQESYLNKIKCIYIDPPYNTGNKNFIYKDDYSNNTKEELLDSGQIDEEGNKFIQNLESNGRYHSDWLSMMYPRLKLARNLLKEDGVIFISIDDNEYDNLKKICDEIFGEDNFIGNFIRNGSNRNQGDFDVRHEYMLCYMKIKKWKFKEEKKEGKYDLILDDKKYSVTDITVRNGGYEYEIPSIDGSEFFIRKWQYCEEQMKERMGGRVEESFNEIYIKNKKELYKKNWILVNNVIFKGSNKIPNNIKTYDSNQLINTYSYFDIESSKKANQELIKMMGGKYFNNPKPVKTIGKIIKDITNKNDIVLDFFSGSSTTAEAVMDLNSKDNGNRKYIMVQLPADVRLENDKDAYDFCIDNNLEPIIPSIAQERIKRAGAKIKEETGADIDYGFRVYKLSDSILNNNKILPKDMAQTSLDLQGSKYVEGIRKEDIVTSIILDLGLMLDSDIKLLDNDCYVIEDNLLFICLSDSFEKSTLNKIKEIEPDQVVLSEDSFEKETILTNTIQEIKNINSDIEVKLI